jgi:prepilin-type N-terminal cleavage/methylation domain-containing protein
MTKSRAGYTLIELLIVITIMFILASIIYPRSLLVIERAHQAKTRSQLGLLRSVLTLYFSDNEGVVPFSGYPDGTAEANNVSLTEVLVPKYINQIPTPAMYDGLWFNGMQLQYDRQSALQMSMTPPREMIMISGPPGYHPFTVHPYVYDPSNGNIYLNDGNRSTAGDFFFDW